MFVHRAVAVAQLTHLHLSVASFGMTTGTVPPECFPVVPVPRKPRRVSFASDVEVMLSTSTLPSPGAEPDSPDQPVSDALAFICTGQDVFVITPPAYVLFTFANPFYDEDMLLRPQFPALPAPSGFSTIDNRQPGTLPGPAGIAARDWSSFIRPGSPSQSLPGWGRPEILDTGSGVNRLPTVISPMAHIPSGDRCETGVPVSVTPVVSDITSDFLDILLNQSFPRLKSDTSVISDGTWFSVRIVRSDRHRFCAPYICRTDDSAGRVPSRHRCRTCTLGTLQAGALPDRILPVFAC